MIFNVVSGGNADYYPLAIHTNVGAEVIVENEYETFIKTADSKGCAAFCLTEGIWNVTSTKDGQSKTISIDVVEGGFNNNNSFDMTVDFIPKLTYTGDYEIIAENDSNWRIHLKTSGDLQFTELCGAAGGIEVFLVGGGGSGGSSSLSGGGGGGGGYTKTGTVEVNANTNYSITIGGGGGSTSAFSYSASAGNNGGAGSADGGGGGGSGTASGGKGGRTWDDSGSSGNAGGDGVYAFGESTYARYGAGGGGGGGYYAAGGNGGKDGGGKGGGDGKTWGSSGKAGTANTGGGGGGAGYNCSGGSGGSGIVIIRNKRS